MELPKVSVVLPTFNRARTLNRAIVSVLQQSFADFELIVVDDASTDDSQAVLAEVEDSRLKIVRHPERRGGSAARNTGVAAARAEWIAFQDSDDEWMPSKLADQMLQVATAAGDVGVCYTGLIKFDGKGAQYVPEPEVELRQGRILDALLKGNFVSTQTLLVRSALLRECGGFDESLPRYQDWDLVIRLARCSNFLFVDRPLAMVYSTAGNISSHPEYDIVARERILQKYADSFADRPKLAARHYFILSRIASRLGLRADARRFAKAALARDPGAWKHWAAVASTSF